MSLGSPAANGGGRPSRSIQWPFVGAAVLLVVLILLTPNLFQTSSSGLETRAQLIVDRASASGNTTFYVDSIGTSTRYQSIAVGLAPLPAWPFKGSTTNLTAWSWTNGTQLLVLTAGDSTNPVAVNVTVKYTAPSGGTTEYVGVYGFYLNTTTLTLDAMTLLAGTGSPPAATPMADLPIFLLLAIQTPTGPTQ